MNKSHVSSAELLRYATELEASGDLTEAASAYAAILKKFPNHPKAKAGSIRVKKTAPSNRTLTRLDEKRLKGLEELLRQGRFSELRDAAIKLLGEYPKIAFVANVAGIALAQLGQHEAAVIRFNEALLRDITFGPAHLNLSTTLRLIGRADAALQSAKEAAKLMPKNVEATVTLGLAYFACNLHDLAKRELNAALKIKPQSFEAYDGLCLIAEGLSDLDELEGTVSRAKQALGKNNASLRLWQGILAARRNEPQLAITVLDTISQEELPIEKQAKFHEQRGKSLDKLERYGDAFEAFSAANECAISRSITGSDQNRYLSQLRASLIQLKRFDRSVWLPHTLDCSGAGLAFLVGFPRSGTTLLDTFLRGHPEIAVIEEQSMVNDMTGFLDDPHNVESVAMLSDEKIAELQAAYFAALNSYAADQDLSSASVVIDKLPLNMNQAPLIRRVFPNARFIFALRHPCDCILSGYMQNFKTNPAMDALLTLESAVNLYDLSMSNWQLAADLLDIQHATVRYERLIDDVEGELMPVVEHLGLNWDASLVDHNKSALSRGVISTPSREQVTQPLYHRSRFRWRNYAAQLAPMMDTLTPWISSWGYDAD